MPILVPLSCIFLLNKEVFYLFDITDYYLKEKQNFNLHKNPHHLALNYLFLVFIATTTATTITKSEVKNYVAIIVIVIIPTVH